MEIYKRILLNILLILIGVDTFAQDVFIDSLNQQAYQRYRENVIEAKALSYKALSLAKENKLGESTVDSYINLGRCFRFTNQWDSAYLVLKLAIQISKEENYDKGLINATNNLGACNWVQGNVHKAYSWFQESFLVAKKVNDQKGQANALNNLFLIAKEQQNFDSAFIFLANSMLVYQQVNDSIGIARVLSNKAYLFNEIQQPDSAISYYFKALRIQEPQNLVYQMARTYYDIGELYLSREQYSDALAYYEKSLVLYGEIGDVVKLANSHNKVGYTLNLMEKYAEALPHLQKGLDYAYESEISSLIGKNLFSLADLYIELNRDESQIREMLEEAVRYLDGTNTTNLAAAYDKLGHLELRQKKFREAQSWFEKELAVATELTEPDYQSIALYNLAHTYEKQNKSTQALEALRQYQNLKDSLDNVETLATINNLNIKYETEKKEKDNLQLQSDLKTSQLEEAKQKLLRNRILGTSIIILFLGLGGFLWYRARQVQRQKEAEKLKELDALKTRFFTNISHEFRTPLTLILGQNEQLKAATDDRKWQNRIEMVGRNGHRLLDLVNQVLDVAKLEAGGMDLNMTRLDAIPFLKNVFYSFESVAEEKEISLTLDNKVEKLETAFDLKKIERVVFNLLSNAVKFTPAGGKIQMQIRQEYEMLKISIKDSGVGIKASQLPNIFDRFYQADSSENQPQPGTGIGLSLVKELVELHDGNISVESELNKGTTFLIALPIPANLDRFSSKVTSSQLSPDSLPSKNLAEVHESFGTATKKEQILLIEDNPDVRAFVKEQILGFGYQVHEAANGLEGLEIAKQVIPDLIISDIMMPKLDGYGVAKGLKEDERTSHIPIIMLTSKASDESKIAGLELGIDDYLLKPFNVKELEIRIENLIEQRKRLRERFTSATVIRPNEVTAVSLDQTFLKKVLDFIEENLTNDQLGVEVVADHVGMSVTHLNRKLSALVDQSAGKMIRSMRLQRAADLLKQKATTVTEIAFELGFNSHTSFGRSFKKQFGVSPKEYMQGEG